MANISTFILSFWYKIKRKEKKYCKPWTWGGENDAKKWEKISVLQGLISKICSHVRFLMFFIALMKAYMALQKWSNNELEVSRHSSFFPSCLLRVWSIYLSYQRGPCKILIQGDSHLRFLIEKEEILSQETIIHEEAVHSPVVIELICWMFLPPTDSGSFPNTYNIFQLHICKLRRVTMKTWKLSCPEQVDSLDKPRYKTNLSILAQSSRYRLVENTFPAVTGMRTNERILGTIIIARCGWLGWASQNVGWWVACSVQWSKLWPDASFTLHRITIYYGDWIQWAID